MTHVRLFLALLTVASGLVTLLAVALAVHRTALSGVKERQERARIAQWRRLRKQLQDSAATRAANEAAGSELWKEARKDYEIDALLAAYAADSSDGGTPKISVKDLAPAAAMAYLARQSGDEGAFLERATNDEFWAFGDLTFNGRLRRELTVPVILGASGVIMGTVASTWSLYL